MLPLLFLPTCSANIQTFLVARPACRNLQDAALRRCKTLCRPLTAQEIVRSPALSFGPSPCLPDNRHFRPSATNAFILNVARLSGRSSRVAEIPGSVPPGINGVAIRACVVFPHRHNFSFFCRPSQRLKDKPGIALFFGNSNKRDAVAPNQIVHHRGTRFERR